MLVKIALPREQEISITDCYCQLRDRRKPSLIWNSLNLSNCKKNLLLMMTFWQCFHAGSVHSDFFPSDQAWVQSKLNNLGLCLQYIDRNKLKHIMLNWRNIVVTTGYNKNITVPISVCLQLNKNRYNDIVYLSLIWTCAVSRFMSDRVRWLLLLEASNTPESPATLSSLTEGGVVVSQMGERGGEPGLPSPEPWDMLLPLAQSSSEAAGGGAS